MINLIFLLLCHCLVVITMQSVSWYNLDIASNLISIIVLNILILFAIFPNLATFGNVTKKKY